MSSDSKKHISSHVSHLIHITVSFVKRKENLWLAMIQKKAEEMENVVLRFELQLL